MSLNAVLEFLRSNKQLQDMRIDSRQIRADDIFIAMPGLTTDGRQYIAQAIKNGAGAVIYEGKDFTDPISIPAIAVHNLAQLLPQIAAQYYANPSQQLKVIGITGTNGKTSTANYVAQLLAAHNLKCGVMGTIGNGVYPDLTPSPLTTSDCVTVQQQLHSFVQSGASHVAMEVSSTGLEQGRMLQTQIDTAAFTNLTQDHLDLHGNMQNYFAAKCKLFAEFDLKHAVINLDDEYAQQLLKLIPANIKVITCSLFNTQADVYLQDNIIHSPWGTGVLQTKLLGKFNISNALIAITICALQGLSLQNILTAAQTLKPVLGRMELIPTAAQTAPKVVVDYAHTPDALIKALQTLREYNPNKLYCIFGCGGDRDRKKRPLMLQAVLANSDEIVITRDNPRTEDSQQIVQDMLAGTTVNSQITIELDRATAIHSTIARAKYGDIVLIAGKGHEDYQIIGTTKHHFSDQEVAQAALNRI